MPSQPMLGVEQMRSGRCVACEQGTSPYAPEQIQTMLREVPGWEYVNGEIARTFPFKNYHETIAFVNATAWISNQQDHHPDLEVGYDKCRVRYSTHSIGGISANDFICAAKLDALMKA